MFVVGRGGYCHGAAQAVAADIRALRPMYKAISLNGNQLSYKIASKRILEAILYEFVFIFPLLKFC